MSNTQHITCKANSILSAIRRYGQSDGLRNAWFSLPNDYITEHDGDYLAALKGKEELAAKTLNEQIEKAKQLLTANGYKVTKSKKA